MQLTIDAKFVKFELPPAVEQRLHALLDRQDQGEGLSPTEHAEAEGLVELAEFLSLLKLRSQRLPEGE